MRQSCFTKLPGAFTGLLASLLLATLALPVGANAASEATTRAVPSTTYDRAHEITVEGTIETVVKQPEPGSPAGLHVVLESSRGTYDAHLGPYLSKDMQEALHTGTPVQIVGAIETGHGHSYLLARQLTVGGSTVTIRSRNGQLVRAIAPRSARAARETKSQVAGGAQ
jgi:hypothetical protein